MPGFPGASSREGSVIFVVLLPPSQAVDIQEATLGPVLDFPSAARFFLTNTLPTTCSVELGEGLPTFHFFSNRHKKHMGGPKSPHFLGCVQLFVNCPEFGRSQEGCHGILTNQKERVQIPW
jgi:hypothetical protein